MLGNLSYYLVALPLSYYFAFVRKDGLSGLWYGFIVGTLLIVIFFITIFNGNADIVIAYIS